MDVVPAFVADGQASEAVQPSDRALDDPSSDAEAAAMRYPPPRHDRRDAAGPEAVAMGLGA
jgi:hypothetical protein